MTGRPFAAQARRLCPETAEHHHRVWFCQTCRLLEMRLTPITDVLGDLLDDDALKHTGGTPTYRHGGLMESREWKPGDDPILPDADPSGYLPESTPLPAMKSALCWLCGNVNEGSSDDSGLCADCVDELT